MSLQTKGNLLNGSLKWRFDNIKSNFHSSIYNDKVNIPFHKEKTKQVLQGKIGPTQNQKPGERNTNSCSSMFRFWDLWWNLLGPSVVECPLLLSSVPSVSIHGLAPFFKCSLPQWIPVVLAYLSSCFVLACVLSPWHKLESSGKWEPQLKKKKNAPSKLAFWESHGQQTCKLYSSVTTSVPASSFLPCLCFSDGLFWKCKLK